MDVFEAIEKRSSVRTFRPDPIPLEHLKKIVDAGRRAPSGGNFQLREFIIMTDPTLIKQFNDVQPTFENVPAVIAVIIEPLDVGRGSYWVQDACAAMENMWLAAVALGYGSRWVEGTVRKKEDWLRGLLGIPKGKRLWALMPIGVPAAPKAQAKKAELKDIVFQNRYGEAMGA